MFKQLTKILYINKVMPINCMIVRNILYSPEDRRYRETQSYELCSISFPLN